MCKKALTPLENPEELFISINKMKILKPIICIVTGAPSSGKSTISEKLANHLHNSTYINVDYIRHMVKSGHVKPFPFTKEAQKEIELSMENAFSLAKNFLKKGFNVFIDDVLERKEQIENYKNNFKGNELFIFLLFPKIEILKKRDKLRGKHAMGKRTVELHKIFKRNLKNKNWNVIDNSYEKPEQTVQRIKKIICET